MFMPHNCTADNDEYDGDTNDHDDDDVFCMKMIMIMNDMATIKIAIVDDDGKCDHNPDADGDMYCGIMYCLAEEHERKTTSRL